MLCKCACKYRTWHDARGCIEGERANMSSRNYFSVEAKSVPRRESRVYCRYCKILHSSLSSATPTNDILLEISFIYIFYFPNRMVNIRHQRPLSIDSSYIILELRINADAKSLFSYYSCLTFLQIYKLFKLLPQIRYEYMQ